MSERFDLLSLVQVDLDATPAITKTSAETAAAMETKISSLRASIEGQLAKDRAARDAELKALDPESRAQVRRLEERVWNDKRRALMRETQEANAEAVEKHLQDLHNQKAKLESLRELVGKSPAHLLSVRGMSGSEKSANYATLVERAAPGTLAQLARKAVATGDLELGAAVANRLANLDPKARPIEPQDLGRALVGDQHAALSKSIAQALDRVEDGLQVAGAWLVGRDLKPLEKVERGLRSHAQAQADHRELGRAIPRRTR